MESNNSNNSPPKPRKSVPLDPNTLPLARPKTCKLREMGVDPEILVKIREEKREYMRLWREKNRDHYNDRQRALYRENHTSRINNERRRKGYATARKCPTTGNFDLPNSTPSPNTTPSPSE